MSTTDSITITGITATTPRKITTSAGLDIATFRLASAERHFDRDADSWVNGETNWYTVTAFRTLAANLFESIEKGDRVIVTGKLRIRNWTTDEKTGTTVEIAADTIGHDLTFGTTTYTRTGKPLIDHDTTADTDETADSLHAAPDTYEDDAEATFPATENPRA